MSKVVFISLVYVFYGILHASSVSPQPAVVQFGAQLLLKGLSTAKNAVVAGAESAGGDVARGVLYKAVAGKSAEEAKVILLESLQTLTNQDAINTLSQQLTGHSVYSLEAGGPGILSRVFGGASSFVKNNPKLAALIGATAVAGLGYKVWKWWGGRKKSLSTNGGDQTILTAEEVGARMLAGGDSDRMIIESGVLNKDQLASLKTQINSWKNNSISVIQKMIQVAKIPFLKISQYTGWSVPDIERIATMDPPRE